MAVQSVNRLASEVKGRKKFRIAGRVECRQPARTRSARLGSVRLHIGSARLGSVSTVLRVTGNPAYPCPCTQYTRVCLRAKLMWKFNTTVFTRLNTAAFITLFGIQVRHLSEGGVYFKSNLFLANKSMVRVMKDCYQSKQISKACLSWTTVYCFRVFIIFLWVQMYFLGSLKLDYYYCFCFPSLLIFLLWMGRLFVGGAY